MAAAFTGMNTVETYNHAEANIWLDRLLTSSVFARAERQKRLLRYLVDETLAGKAASLKGYTIGVEVFDREANFDPAIDAIVRVQAGQLRAKLREHYDGEGRGDAVRFDMPKGAYAIQFHARSQGIADAWAGESAVNSPMSKQDGAIRPGSFDRVHPIEDKPSLAVLPFTNWSSDPEQEYFADGITEDLTTELSKVSGLFVISRHSAFVYKGVAMRAGEIATELGVRYLLEGSVRRCGQHVRISAQLIDATSSAHVWAERYDRKLKDIFVVQDDVTRRIVELLKVNIEGVEKRRNGSGTPIEVHDCLLRGLERFWLFTPESTNDARARFAHAIELGAGYAPAHAWLARVLVFRWIMFWESVPESLERAYEHARLAVELDDRSPLAYSVLGWVQLWRKQGQTSIAAGERAVALDPNNADAHLFLSYSLSALGRGEEALHYIEKGMRLNPHPSAVYLSALAQIYVVLEDYDNAIAACRRGIELTDVFIPNHYWLCMVYTLLARDEEARVERDAVFALSGGRRPILQSIWLDEALLLRVEGLAQLAGLG